MISNSSTRNTYFGDSKKDETAEFTMGKPRLAVNGPGPENHNSDIFFAAVETTRMPMCITDPSQPDNPIIFANDAFIEMTQYPLNEIIGRNCRFLQGPKTDPTAVAQVKDGITRQVDVSVELLNYKKDGSTFWNALFVSPVRDNNGKLIYYFASQLDVTRRRVAEDAVRQSQKMEALGQLTGGLAHDFNNLLQVVVGHLDRAKMKLADITDVSVIRSIDHALGAAEKGAALTQQLLSFARKQRLDQRTVNLNELVNSIADMARRTVGLNIDYNVVLEPNLMSAKVDPTQTEMAVLNILINARDAMPHGGSITIKTENWPASRLEGLAFEQPDMKGHHVCVSISDTGTGIPPEVIDRVTEPFFTTKDQGKGTGLGLSMVYGYMRQSGGAMHIETEVGKGTTIFLFFPSSSEVMERHADQPERMAQKGSETILIVEDQPEVMELTSIVLKEAGYKILTAGNAKEAMRVAEMNPHIDVLFSDIIMPGGMNGVTLAHEMSRMRPDIKILLTTGYSENTMDQTTTRPSRWPVLQKPYRPSGLMTAMRETIDGA
jgi:PAS domain S-box-containing protein